MLGLTLGLAAESRSQGGQELGLQDQIVLGALLLKGAEPAGLGVERCYNGKESLWSGACQPSALAFFSVPISSSSGPFGAPPPLRCCYIRYQFGWPKESKIAGSSYQNKFLNKAQLGLAVS